MAIDEQSDSLGISFSNLEAKAKLDGLIKKIQFDKVGGTINLKAKLTHGNAKFRIEPKMKVGISADSGKIFLPGGPLFNVGAFNIGPDLPKLPKLPNPLKKSKLKKPKVTDVDGPSVNYGLEVPNPVMYNTTLSWHGKKMSVFDLLSLISIPLPDINLDDQKIPVKAKENMFDDVDLKALEFPITMEKFLFEVQLPEADVPGVCIDEYSEPKPITIAKASVKKFGPVDATTVLTVGSGSTKITIGPIGIGPQATAPVLVQPPGLPSIHLGILYAFKIDITIEYDCEFSIADSPITFEGIQFDELTCTASVSESKFTDLCLGAIRPQQ
ncbi:MAG: hypothetical protein U0105_09705 [Candidatus Obscuribacterales bacterium]